MSRYDPEQRRLLTKLTKTIRRTVNAWLQLHDSTPRGRPTNVHSWRQSCDSGLSRELKTTQTLVDLLRRSVLHSKLARTALVSIGTFVQCSLLILQSSSISEEHRFSQKRVFRFDRVSFAQAQARPQWRAYIDRGLLYAVGLTRSPSVRIDESPTVQQFTQACAVDLEAGARAIVGCCCAIDTL